MLLAWVVIVCCLIYLSFIGWGQIITRYDEETDFAMAAAYGLAFSCVVGGVLNWFHLISSHSIQIYLLIGLIYWTVLFVKNRQNNLDSLFVAISCLRRNKIASIVFVTLFTISISYSSLPVQNDHDDNHGYLVFPHQMLQTGHIANDPFNERRMGVFGGQSFLNATMLTFISYKQLRAFDAVLGWLVFIMLVITHSYQSKVPSLALILLLSLWHWFPPPAANISSLVTALALFYAFLRRFKSPGLHQNLLEVIKTGILVAALCSLKATNIAGVGFFAAFLFLFDRRILFTEGLIQGIKVAIVGLLLVSPWMFAMYQSNGTFLFPLLGQGTHTSWEQGAAILSIRIQDINWAYLQSILILPLSTPALFAGIILLLLGRLNDRKALRELNPAAISGFLAAIVSTLFLSFMSLGLSRYSYSYSFAAFVFLMTEAFSNNSFCSADSQSLIRKKIRYRIAWLAIAFYAGTVWPTTIKQLNHRIVSIYNFKAENLRQFPRSIIAAAQNSTQPGSSILAVLSHPYLMDFSRNQIFVIDHAGSTSPSPGFPISGTEEEIVSYLRKQDIKYLMFSYADDAGYGYEKYKQRLNWAGSPYAKRVQILAKNNFKLHKQLIAIAKIYPLVHQDNYSIMIDITAPKTKVLGAY